MRILDTSRPFGMVNPPYRASANAPLTCFAQDEFVFDAQGREIVQNGEAKNGEAPQEDAAILAKRAIDFMARLIREADQVPLGTLRRKAGIVLGDSLPSKKDEIVAALQALLAVQRAHLATGAGAAMTMPRAPAQETRKA
jgi:hypothetical protein